MAIEKKQKDNATMQCPKQKSSNGYDKVDDPSSFFHEKALKILNDRKIRRDNSLYVSLKKGMFIAMIFKKNK